MHRLTRPSPSHPISPLVVHTPLWLRGEAVAKGDQLVLDRERAQTYPFYSEPDALFSFLAVRNYADALAFVRRYGLLWHGPDDTDHREKLSDWEAERVWLSDIVRRYEELHRALHGDASGIEDLWLEEPRISSALGTPTPTTDAGLIATASTYLARLISAGLHGVEERVRASAELEHYPGLAIGPGEFVLEASPPDLLAYIYHQFALIIVRHDPVDYCPECGRLFIVEDKRQRFCTPVCAARARYHRYMDRHRAESALSDRDS